MLRGTMTMLQATAKTVLSLALLFLSYIFVGWGTVFGTWRGVAVVLVGSFAYFCSLFLAERSKFTWVFALVISLGAILGLVVLFVCLPNLIVDRRERWTSIVVLLIEVFGLIAYFAVRRRYRRHDG